MYENGRKLNRYSRMKRHKKNLKDSFAKQNNYYGGRNYNEMLVIYRNKVDNGIWYNTNRNYEKNGDMDYWYELNLSGPKQYAKKLTSHKLRQQDKDIRHLVFIDFEEDIPYLKNNDYQKIVDYNWIVW